MTATLNVTNVDRKTVSAPKAPVDPKAVRCAITGAVLGTWKGATVSR